MQSVSFIARSVTIILAVGIFASGCGGPSSTKSPDEVVPLDDTAGSSKSTSHPPLDAAVERINAKDFEGARHYLESVLAKDQKNSDGWFYLGVSLQGLGEVDQSAEAFEKAIALNQALTDAYVNLAAVRLDQKKFAEVLKVVEQGLRVAPKQPDLMVNRALALEGQGQKAEAMAAYAEAAKVRPDDFTLHVSLAQMLADAGKKNEALSEAKLARQSNDPRLLAVAAKVERQLSAFADCVATLDRAVNLMPADKQPEATAAVYVRRGMCREDAKDTPGAKADYTKALALAAQFPPAYYYLGLLYEEAGELKQACLSLKQAAALGGTQGIGPDATKAVQRLKCK